MKQLKTFVEKSLSVFRMGGGWVQRLFGSLAEAARSISYVETVNPSQTDTLHRDIKLSDDRLFKKGFEQCVREVIPKLALNSKVKVAIDITEDLYWGESSSSTRVSAHEHDKESWQYINLSVVDPCFIPLMSLPYRQIDDADDLVIELLEYLRTLPLKVELVLFDRGFFHWHLIDYLNGQNRRWAWPYLIFVPKNSVIQNFIDQTKMPFASFAHGGSYRRDKTTWKAKTNIIVIKAATKNKREEPIDWSFATNQPVHLGLVLDYKKRWNIETGFRVHDEARIKTKSTNVLIRYFYHLIGMLFILEWRLQKKTVPCLSFKRELKLIEFYFYDKLIYPPP